VWECQIEKRGGGLAAIKINRIEMTLTTGTRTDVRGSQTRRIWAETSTALWWTLA
jgi:hypothetical protein